MRAPIHSKKHFVQISQATVAQAIVNLEALVVAKEATSTTPTDVEEGALVKACYIEFWLGNASSTVVGSYTLILYKNPAGGANATTANLAALHDYANKKNILFTSQALAPPTDGGQVPVMKGWYKIPKGKQRFGLGDKLHIAIRNNNATAIDINYCGFAVFKEYT